jgi:hypothetical protein
MTPIKPISLLFVFGACAPLTACAPDVPSAPTYVEDVRPIFIAACVRCHGAPDATTDPSVPIYFRLDTWDPVGPIATTGVRCGTGTQAVCGVADLVAMRPEEQLHDIIVERASVEATMPPESPLSDRQREILGRWADAGWPKGTRAGNRPPEIVFVSPTGDLQVDQSLDFEVLVSDPDGDTVIWGLRWRDASGTGWLAEYLEAGRRFFTVDTGSLASGAYQLEAVLSDGVLDAPVTAVAPVTITIPDGRTAAPIVDVTRPAGGELIRAPGTVRIEWTVSDSDTAVLSGELVALRTDAAGQEVIATLASLPTGTGSQDWVIDAVAPGTYQVQLTVTDGMNERSDVSGELTIQGAPMEVSFAADIQPIFTAHCATTGCHNNATIANKQLDLSAGQAWGNLVGMPSAECPSTLRVEAGSPDTSYMMWKLVGSGPCFTGSRMPKMGSIPPADVSAISDWIFTGAANN